MSWTFWLFLIIVVPALVIATLAQAHFKGKTVAAKAAVAAATNADNRFNEANKIKAVTDEKNALVTYGMTVLVKRVLIGLGLILLVASSVWFVPVRNVGIVTAFSAPTGRSTGNGLKVTWPWEEIEDFDASVQVADHTGADHCTTVRIGSLATACVENKIQWQVQEVAAPKLFRDYKGNFDNLRNNLVETYIQNALNSVFSTYNPLSQVNIQTGQTTFDGAKLGKDVEAELVKTIGSDIKILTVSVPLVHHDAKTEDNIKQFQDVIAKARILEQANKNATLEKEVADKQRAFLTPEYIQNKCIEESVKMGVPPGYCLMNGAIVNAPTAK